MLTLIWVSLAPTIIGRVLNRSRDYALDIGCLVLAGLEILVGPMETAPVGGVSLLLRAATRVPAGWPRAGVAAVIGVAGFALSVNVFPPWDGLHHAFFLFPMRDVAAGKSLLVDVNAQYGVGLIYALTWLTGWSVEDVTPTALSAWTNVANVALYVGLWGMCAWLVRDWALGSVSWLAVVVNRTVTINFSGAFPLEAYPSTGAWRFGLPWLLVADAAAVRDRMAPWRRVLRTTYWMVASTWSLEVAIYSAVIFASDLVIDAIRCWRHGEATGRWQHFMGRVAEVVLGSVTGVLLLVGVTRWRANQWPDPRHYFEYFETYGAGLGFEQPEIASAWSPMLLGCASLMVVLALRAGFAASADGGDASRDKVVALVGAYGVLQFTYYAFRPHSNNLLHVMFPPSVLAVWLLGHMRRWIAFSEAISESGDARVVVGAAVVCGMALVGASGLTALVPRVPTTLAGQANRLWDEGRLLTGPWFGSFSAVSDGEGEVLRNLLTRRYPNKSRVPMLLGDDLWIFAIIKTRFVNVFPISFEKQDAIVEISTSMIEESVRKFPLYEEIIIEVERDRMTGLRRVILGMLCERGSLIPLESVGRVIVVQFTERRGGSDLCQSWGMVPVP